ncbi:hypothetical protein [Massilia sp. Root351]|nr:hypothetical protein [Massilia sp. Root351]
MRNVTLLTLMLAAAFTLAACQDKPIEPMKPRVAWHSAVHISPAI